MTMFASHAPGEVIDAIRPDLEAFTSLWTALRVNYEGTNITRTVARLLHMYQPEEGVVAYERLLRTLFVLLEDFDSDGLQLLVSMVPPPKGVSDEVVKEVFNRATGFVRVDAPILHKNTDTTIAASSTPESIYPRPESQSCSSTAIQQSEVGFLSENSSAQEIKKNPHPTVQNDSNGPKNRMTKSPQIISQESSEVFRGFPPSEIYNTQSHVQSIKNFYRPSTSFAFSQSGGQRFLNFGQIVGQNSGQLQQPIGPGLVGSSYRPKWFQSPYLIQKNSYPVAQYQDFYLKTVNNQYVKVPAAKVNNFHQGGLSAAQGSYQNLYNNAHDYLRNRSNTVTSGLLEKIQRHRSLQEAANLKILTECKSSKNSCAFSAPRVPDTDVPSSQRNVEFKIVDLKLNCGEQDRKITENPSLKKPSIGINSKSRNLVIKTCDLSDKFPAVNDRSEFIGNGDVKIGSELDLGGKNRETFEEFAKEVRMRQRAIQEDIYKMDVVQTEIFPEEGPGNKEDADNLVKPEMLTASGELRNSCKNFIARAKSEEVIDVPKFPNTRALSDIHEKSAVLHPSESNLWRLLTSKNVVGSNIAKTGQAVDVTQAEEFEEPSVDQELVVSPTEIAAKEAKESLESSGSGPKRVIRRKKPEVSSTRGKSQRVVQKGTIISNVTNLQDNSVLTDRDNGPEPDIRIMSNSQPEPTSRCPLSTASQTSSSSSIGPATTMAELAAYKKQYYDALLSIQKAKAAVANSLAISSVGSSPGFDPYYYNYLQQQRHQIFQRHQHQMIMGQRFSQQQSLAAGTPWFRNPNWRYPVISQSRIPQRPQMLHSSSSMWPPGVGYLGRDSQNMPIPQRQQLNVVQVTKPPVKRRKLEEIVGKLKETESNGTNN